MSRVRLRRGWPLVVPVALLTLFGQIGDSEGAARIRAVDTYVFGDTNLVPGSRARLRIVTMGATSLVGATPLARAAVRVSMQGGSFKQKLLFEGSSDQQGAIDAAFEVPSWPDGSYELAVETSSPHGDGALRRAVTLKQTGKILLVTDKPIYQPGQLIHLRALGLDAHSLKPLAKAKLRFEVQDPKGNKVFKQRVDADAFGVAHTQFQLAHEINLGNYQIEVVPERANLAAPAQKTVVVKKYVLPKFKVGVETAREYYLPKELIKGSVQADYFFGKPVAGGKVEVKASTFDVAFKEFATLRGKTDKTGRWEFELRLPDYFVGQPLQKGDAVVKLEIKVTDTAKHPEKGVKSVPVAADPIRLAAVPAGGRVVAGLENRIFVVATYPDGSPAQATVTMHRQGKEAGRVETDETGLGLFTLTPRADELRAGGVQAQAPGLQRRIRPGLAQTQVQTQLLDLVFEARDRAGKRCRIEEHFATDPAGDQVLLTAEKAIYQAGDTLRGTVLTTAGDGTAYLDIIKGSQTLLTRTLALERGRGDFSFSIGPDVFGTVELHAYKILAGGEVVRDARVLYVQPPRALNVKVSSDKKVYRPGETAKLSFRVLDPRGRPSAAALGVIVVDEAVYALQELKPGLEKVYFTLEKELADPKYQIEFGPSDDIASLIKRERLERQQQQVASVLLAKVVPQAEPALWANPVQGRMQKAEGDRHVIQSAINGWGQQHPIAARLGKGRWAYRPRLIDEMVQGKHLNQQNATDPLGDAYTMPTVEALWPELRAEAYLPQLELQRLWNLRNNIYSNAVSSTSNFSELKGKLVWEHLTEAFNATIKHSVPKQDLAGQPYRWKQLAPLPGFKVQDMVGQLHAQRAQRIYAALSRYGQEGKRWYRRSYLDKENNTYEFPRSVVRRCIKRKYLREADTRDVWGRPFRLKKLKQARAQIYYDQRLRYYSVFSAGPDGQDGTADDLDYGNPMSDGGYQALARSMGVSVPAMNFHGPRFADDIMGMEEAGMGGGGMLRALRGGVAREAAPMPTMAAEAPGARPQSAAKRVRQDAVPRDVSGVAAPKKRQVRVRQFFPETLLFMPALIADASGRASLEVPVADSITTWRLTASANGKGGGLGATTSSIRVFQDFFVDLDLPVALTQNDEVSIPVVVYNYLKTPQRVRLELKRGDWFSLQGGTVQELRLAPQEVAATYYRVKVTGLGQRTLEVRADGSAMSDAIRRQIEVLPDGKEANVVASGRLLGRVKKTIDIPQSAVPGASKILVRMYPGVFSQVVEGMESLLRLPGG